MSNFKSFSKNASNQANDQTLPNKTDNKPDPATPKPSGDQTDKDVQPNPNTPKTK
ncbi:hypothetical protein [Acinetobacter sp. WZC-1]|uniref:hypothetical protein n=1 Tax=Acinetobacter sp. WZC-1 TaxID=3459034 RepID=UPI00403D7723